MLGFILFAASAYAAYLSGNWFAIGNAAVNFWSLGIIHNYAKATGLNAPVRDNYERLAITINAATSLIGVGLLVTRLVFQ